MKQRPGGILFALILLGYFSYAQQVNKKQGSAPIFKNPQSKEVSRTPSGRQSFLRGNQSSFPVLGSTDQKTPIERTCFTVENEQNLKRRFPNRLSTESFESRLSSHLESARLASSSEIVYHIPTIVHVVHNDEPIGTGSNISREQVMSQFDVLNEDFRRIGGGYNEHPSGADIRVEFVPALLDPQGNVLAEPGIDRVFGYTGNYEYFPIELELKPNTQWDPDLYFNIWVLNFGGSMGNVLGYAQFPTLSGLDGLPDDAAAETDGVVIGYKYFGRTGNVVEPFHLGRTATHEVGHWLGLRHIWGDGDCSVDDYCADTPNADGPNHSCVFRDSCPGDGADMIENYMDYSTDPCMNIFTADQRTRMRTVMESSPRRRTLVACQQAPIAQIGNNYLKGARGWFEYTSTASQVVTISSIGTTQVDSKLSLFRSCNSLPVSVSEDAFGTKQSELSISVEVGETIKILWEQPGMEDSLGWVLSTGSQVSGATCELASVASTGTNSVPSTTLKTYWFTFSPGSNDKKIRINTGGRTASVYGNGCTTTALLKSGSGQLTIYDIDTSESIFIAIEANGGNFDWTLNVDDLRTGESCDQAVLANVGQNTIPYQSPFKYWYTYTMPGEGTLSIASMEESGSPIHVTVYKECGGAVLARQDSSKINLPNLHLKGGETVRISFDAEFSTENFIWELTASPFENGESCYSAREAQSGINHTDAAPQWFIYTTTKPTNLRISSVGYTEANTQLIIKRSCDGPIAFDNDDFSEEFFSLQSELIMYGMSGGEQIYILWSEKWSYEGFDWILEEIDPLPGDNCSSAKQAVVGTNTIERNEGHSHFGNIFWTKFTVPESGKKVMAFSSIPVDLAVYITPDCSNYTWLAEDQGKVQVFDLPAGQEILIIWDRNGYEADFTWELSVEDIAPGDLCTNPLTAVLGINESSSSPVWYEYVMTQDGSLEATYGAENSIFGPAFGPIVAFLDGCGDDASILYIDNNKAFVSGLREGQHVYIYWTPGYPFPGVKWFLDEHPAKQGDSCSDPLPAAYGLNQAEYATQWFSYTVAESGGLKISSRAFTFNNTNLFVYEACEESPLASSDDILVLEDGIIYFQSEVILDHVDTGQELLIKWAGTYSFTPFTWEITNNEPRPGDTCENPIPAQEGINNAMKPAPAWFSFTMPSSSILTLSTSGLTELNTNVEVYDECNGTLLTANDDGADFQSVVHLEGLSTGQTLLIRWANNLPSEQYTFDWNLIVGDPDPGLFCEYPKEAQIGTNTTPDYLSNYYWFTYTMPDDGMKLIVTRLGEPSAAFTTLGVSRSCDLFEVLAFDEMHVEVLGLAEGEEVLIFSGEVVTGERQGFQWDLSVSEPEAGDTCENPIAAFPGVNSSNGYTTWFSYKAPRTSEVRISSVDLAEGVDTYLEVYDACGGALLAFSDNPDDYSHFQSEVVLDLEENQDILIRWALNYPFQEEFEWELEVGTLENQAPELEDQTIALSSVPVNGKLVGTLTGEDADGDELFYRIASGNTDGIFALEASTGKLTIKDASQIPSEGLTCTLEVEVTDNIDVTSGSVNLDILTAVHSPFASISIYPNPTSSKITVQVPDGLEVFHLVIRDISGRAVKTTKSVTDEILIQDLSEGIYMLHLQTNKGSFETKVVVSR